MAGRGRIGRRWGWTVLNLTFDIDRSKGLAFGGLEYLASLPSQKPKFGLFFLEKILAIIVTNELGGIAI